MKWFILYLMQRPGRVVLGLVVLTAVALWGCLRVTTDPSNERLFLRRSQAYQVYQHFRTTFGSDETILVVLHDAQHTLLQPDGIAAIRALTQDLMALPDVDDVSSLTTIQDMTRLRLTAFGIAAPRLIEEEPLTTTQVNAIRTNDFLLGTFLSADLHTAGLLVTPAADALTADRFSRWLATLRTRVASHARDGRQTYLAGTPVERHDVTSYLQRDQQIIVPLVMLIFLGITYGLYRNLRLAFLPLIGVMFALIWTMGVVGFSGRPLNLITSLLPPVLMVVSVSTAIHLMHAFLTARTTGSHALDAVQQAVQRVGMACLLTALTTMLGFFSLLVSPVPAVREFALFAGIGVFLAFCLCYTVIPLLLLKFGRLLPIRQRPRPYDRLERLLAHSPSWVWTHRRSTAVGTLLVLILLLPGLLRLTEGTDIVRALKRTAPLRVSTEFIDAHLTGVNSLELMLSLPATDIDAAFIRRVLEFSRWLRAQTNVTAVHSPWEPLRGVKADYLTNDEQLRVLAALLPLSLPLASWLDVDAKALRISVRVKAMGSDRFLLLARQVAREAAQVGLSMQLTGTNYLLAQMSRTLVYTQIRSLLVAIALILGSIGFVLRSWRLGLIAAIPNLLPLLMIFGLMGWCGIMLSTATTMIASVALGLIVDDTIHLLYHYHHATDAGQPPSMAITQAMRQTGPALVITTLILTLGFWAGLVGSFKPTVSFAFLTGLTMILALLADLLVLPAILLFGERED